MHHRAFRSRGRRDHFNSRPKAARPKFNQPAFDPSLLINQAQPVKEQAYTAEHRFADFRLHSTLAQNIKSKGYNAPTPIQDQIIPHILEGRDVIGLANTGTGKTAAFLVPLIEKMINNPETKVLIITPTRELAMQISEEFAYLSNYLPLRSVQCIGGVPIGGQIRGLRTNPQVIVGTPGRLKDLYAQCQLDFVEFNTIVLDEVDRMLDMGFIKDIRGIIDRLPPNRHSLFFSATLPDSIRPLMQTFLNNPVTVSVAKRDTAATVNQNIVEVNGQAKIDVLHDLLVKKEFEKVLVFGRTKWSMEKLAKTLSQRGFKAAAIHGNKTQNQRQRALDEFKANRLQVLIATDIASRGLDIEDVTHVINYDLPETYEDYIHRIGRTGRAGKIGTALTFID